MKYLFTLIFLTGLFASAQDELLLPNVEGYWDVKAWTWDHDAPGGGKVPCPYGSYKIYTGSDSIFDEGKYWYQVRDEFDGDYLGQISADSGMVYFKSYVEGYPADVGTETVVLYDFNKTEGDTVYVNGIDFVTVESVGTTEILGEERYSLNLNNGETWIEGMGSDMGFYNPIINYFECAPMMCSYSGDFKNDDGTEFSLFFAGMEEYPCFIGINEDELTNAPVYFPNPATSILTIEIEGKEQSYEIIDALGKSWTAGKLIVGANQIDVTTLNRGIYILKVSNTKQLLIIE